MKWFDISVPNRYVTTPVMEPADDRALAIDWPAVLDAATKEFPDLEPRRIVPSINGSATVIVHGNLIGTVYERGITYVVLSKRNRQALFKYEVRQQLFGPNNQYIQAQLHFVDFGWF